MEATLQPAAENQLDRLRTLADKLDCLTETDIMLLGKLSQSTVEAWRKRGTGPAYILLGNRYLYWNRPASQRSYWKPPCAGATSSTTATRPARTCASKCWRHRRTYGKTC